MANFNLLRRIPIIHEQILSGTYPNKNTLRNHIAKVENAKAVSISTVGNIIEFMKNELGAPIEYEAQMHGYYYSNPNYEPPLYNSAVKEKNGLDNMDFNKMAKAIGIEYDKLLNLVKSSNLGVKDQGEFEFNLGAKYCGRNLFGGLVWFGLREFSYDPGEWKLAVAFTEDYHDVNKTMTQKLQIRHLDYIAEDSPLDECFFLYHILDLNLLLQDQEIIKHIFMKFVDYITDEDYLYLVESYEPDMKGRAHEDQMGASKVQELKSRYNKVKKEKPTDIEIP